MTDDSTQAYQRLAEQLADQGVTTGQMFGKPSLKVGTKAMACLYRDSVAFKLGAGTAEHRQRLS